LLCQLLGSYWKLLDNLLERLFVQSERYEDFAVTGLMAYQLAVAAIGATAVCELTSFAIRQE